MRTYATPAVVAGGLLTLLSLSSACSSPASSPEEGAAGSTASAFAAPAQSSFPPMTCVKAPCNPDPEPIPAAAADAGADAADAAPAGGRVLTCTQADLTPPANAADSSFACAGPWAYLDYVAPCVAQVTDKDKCGQTMIGPAQTCYNYNWCQNAQFGVAHYDNYTTTQVVTGIYHRGHKDCDPDLGCIVTQPWTDYQTPCTNAGNAYLNSVRYQNHVTDGSGWATTQLSGATCSITANLVPTYNWGNGAVCGVASSYDCSTYQANTCRPATGPLDPDRGACGTGSTVYSSSNLSRLDLAGTDSNAVTNDSRYAAPSCTTCENLPVVTAADVQAKHDCLAKSVTAFKQRNDAADLSRVATDIKLLLELRAGDLQQVDRQTFTLQLFQDRPDITDTCALGWTRPAGPFTCPASERTQIDGALSLCGAIAQSTILPDARAGFVDYCVDTVRGMPGLVDCEGYYDAYTQIMTTLQTSMQNSLVPGNTRDAALLAKVHAVLNP